MHLRSFSEQMYAFTRATGKLGEPSLTRVAGGTRGARYLSNTRTTGETGENI